MTCHASTAENKGECVHLLIGVRGQPWSRLLLQLLVVVIGL